MKKYPLLFSALCLLFTIPAFTQKGIKGLVDAEKAFASFTSSHTVKEGFLQYMDINGLIFRQGNALNAQETFQKQNAGPAILNWEPAFAIVSASGDFGIATGPYRLQPSATKDTPVNRGSFSSVWQINQQGVWKNLADLGVTYRKQSPEIKQVQEIVLLVKNNTPVSFEEVLALDKKFNQDLKEKNGGTLSTQIAADSWLNLEGETPITGVALIANVLIHIPDTVLFRSESGKIASSGDLAYVYGTVINGNKKENYLRVWANRNKRWQVILQTIKW